MPAAVAAVRVQHAAPAGPAPAIRRPAVQVRARANQVRARAAEAGAHREAVAQGSTDCRARGPLRVRSHRAQTYTKPTAEVANRLICSLSLVDAPGGIRSAKQCREAYGGVQSPASHLRASASPPQIGSWMGSPLSCGSCVAASEIAAAAQVGEAFERRLTLIAQDRNISEEPPLQ